MLKNLIKKKSNYEERNEIVKLQNEIIIFEIVFGMVNGWPYEEFQNILHIPILITHHYNFQQEWLPEVIGNKTKLKITKLQNLSKTKS